MFRRYVAVSTAGLLLVAGQASAAAATANLDSVRGQVMVSQGAGFVQTSGSTLKPGDRVVAMGDGWARVNYADGCVVGVAPKAMATIGAQSPCAAKGAVRAAEPGQFWEDGSWLWVIVGIGLLAIIIAAADDDDEEPVSP